MGGSIAILISQVCRINISWASIPENFRQCQVVYTDGLKSYYGVIPLEKYQATSQGSGKTNPIERLKNTLRQRCSILVRKGLSFSKSWFITKVQSDIWYITIMLVYRKIDLIFTTSLSLPPVDEHQYSPIPSQE